MCRLKFKIRRSSSSSNYTKLKITQKGDIYYLRGSYREKQKKYNDVNIVCLDNVY
jgi:hypothetical protein